jgi:ABC-2 type transport system permease protein
MRILDLALKDLSQIFRDKRSLLFLVAMPLIFTLFMGFAYRSGSEDPQADSRVPLGWVDNDAGGLLSTQLFQMLSASDSIRLVELEPSAADGAVAKGEVAGALLVPAGYSDKNLAGQGPQLVLIGETTSAAGQAIYQALRTAITKLISSVEIARLDAEATGKAGDPAERQAAFQAASQAWSETDSAGLVHVEMAVAQSESAWYGDNPYNQASPGILVQFAIFGLVTSGQILVQERKSRTLQRMISTSMPAWEIVAGHLLAMFSVVFLQVALLVLFGQLALGVNYARQPLGVLMISVALGLWIAAMGLLIGVMVKDDSQVVLFSLMAMFIFSAMGGAWFPLEGSGGAFASIGRLMPSAWAMNGYQNILVRGLGLGSTWLPVLILLAYSLAFFGLAVWRFRRIES